MKIVLDTNCLIPILVPGSFGHDIWQAFRQGRYTLCVSTEILLEYEEILMRMTEDGEFTSLVIETISNAPNVERVRPAYRFNLITADPDDNKFVDCAIAANARFIVTEDHHFNVLKDIPFPSVSVVNIDEFLSELESNYS